MKYWLFKSEPTTYSYDDLERDGSTEWDGVRNFQARNFLRNDMKVGDQVLFYYSSTNPQAVVGIAEIVKAGYPDSSAWDPKDKHFDPKSTEANPIWYRVDIAPKQRFKQTVTLEAIKKHPSLGKMVLVQRSRLSIQPVEEDEWRTIVDLGMK